MSKAFIKKVAPLEALFNFFTAVIVLTTIATSCMVVFAIFEQVPFHVSLYGIAAFAVGVLGCWATSEKIELIRLTY